MRSNRRIRAKCASLDLRLQIPPCEANTRETESQVTPLEREFFPHETGRNQNANRHRDEKQRSGERDRGGRFMQGVPGVEAIMRRIKGPRELPSAEILLPALLVKVSEQKKEQQGNNARHNDHADGNASHVSGLRLSLIMARRWPTIF